MIDKKLGWLKDFTDPRDFTVDHPEVTPFLLKRTVFGDKDGAAIPHRCLISDTIDLPPIMDQGSLGSCTANAASYMYQVYLRVAELDGNEPFSRLFLYKVARNLLGWEGDTGAYLRTMMQALCLFGAPPESFYPYEAEKFDIEPSGFLYSLASNYQALKYYRLDKQGADPDKVVESIKVNLAANRACMFGFVVFSNLDQSGDVAYPGSHDKQKGGHAVCFAGDTKISLLDGRELSLVELASEFKTKPFWVYSCDVNGNLVPGKAHSPRCTQKQAKLVAVELDNGEKVKCTPEHRWMLRTGSYREAQHLQAGDSLMPLYRKISSNGLPGYELAFNPGTGRWGYTHQLVDSVIEGPKQRGRIIHHKDVNPRNNSPCNLVRMNNREHSILHNIIIEGSREFRRQYMKDKWEDPHWREKMLPVLERNGHLVSAKLFAENRLGFQVIPTYRMKQIGHAAGLRNVHFLQTPAAQKACRDSFALHMETNEQFAISVKNRGAKNISQYNNAVSTGSVLSTEGQLAARSSNAKRLNQNKELRRRAQAKTTYTRFYQDKYPTYQHYLAVKRPELVVNHKVVSVLPCGSGDVYDITVEEHHNFALSAGVFVHNCAVGYDDNYKIGGCKGAFVFANSWSRKWGRGGFGWLPYDYVRRQLATDWWTMMSAEWVNLDVFK